MGVQLDSFSNKQKEIPEEFYIPYFELAEKNNLQDQKRFKIKLFELDILRKEDTEEESEFLSKMFFELLSLFTMPFQSEYFDFSDPVFFQKIAELGAKLSKNSDLLSVEASFTIITENSKSNVKISLLIFSRSLETDCQSL